MPRILTLEKQDQLQLFEKVSLKKKKKKKRLKYIKKKKRIVHRVNISYLENAGIFLKYPENMIVTHN